MNGPDNPDNPDGSDISDGPDHVVSDEEGSRPVIIRMVRGSLTGSYINHGTSITEPLEVISVGGGYGGVKNTAKDVKGRRRRKVPRADNSVIAAVSVLEGQGGKTGGYGDGDYGCEDSSVFIADHFDGLVPRGGADDEWALRLAAKRTRELELFFADLRKLFFNVAPFFLLSGACCVGLCIDSNVDRVLRNQRQEALKLLDGNLQKEGWQGDAAFVKCFEHPPVADLSIVGDMFVARLNERRDDGSSWELDSIGGTRVDFGGQDPQRDLTCFAAFKVADPAKAAELE